MVQKKMRPMFSRGHSVASFSVARDGAGKQDDEPGAAAAEPQSQEGVGGSAAAASAAASAPLSPQQLRRRRRRQLAARLRVSFAEPSVVTARHPAGEPLTDKELRAYFYSADDLKRFDRDRAITAHLHRTGKGHDGGDGPWDDNVHSIRGLEDFLKISGCNHVIQPFRPPSPSDPAPPPPRDAPARGAAAAAARGRAAAATTTTTASAAERERREHARLVLSEQDRLRSPLGPDAPPADPASLAEASSRSSDGPRAEALERGREDAAVAARLAGPGDAATASRLQAVRGRLYALVERPPSVRSLLALDRQGSLRSLVAGVVGGGSGVASSAPGSGAATPLPHHQHHPLPPPAAGGAAARFLGPSDKQPSLRSLLGRGGGVGGGADK